MTFDIGFNSVRAKTAGGKLRDLQVALPSGIIGDPHAVPQCKRQQFFIGLEGGRPPSTQVGVDRPRLAPTGRRSGTSPVQVSCV